MKMKKIFNFVIGAALCINIVHANESTATVEEVCSAIGDLAEAVMAARQAGVPFKKVLDINPKPEERDLFKLMSYEITLEAYRRSRYDSEELQQKVIDEFSNSMHINCLDGLR